MVAHRIRGVCRSLGAELLAATAVILRRQTPDRARRTGLPGSVPTGFDSRICILCQIDEGIRRYEHRFPSLPLAPTEIERWRRECNEELPKKALSGLTPGAYAKQLK